MARLYLYKRGAMLSAAQRQRAAAILSAPEKRQISEFKRAGDRETALLSRYLQKKVLSSFLHVRPGEIILRRNRFGRPELKFPAIKNFDFNVSHAGEFIVIAVNPRGRAGIDIEEIRPVDAALYGDYLSDEEKDYIRSRPERAPEAFYKIWTLREAYLKARGDGLSYPLENFHFHLRGRQIHLVDKQKTHSWSFRCYRPAKRYQMALCLDGDAFPKKIDMLDI
jgi:4'-phosphopantetheinyl transferase